MRKKLFPGQDYMETLFDNNNICHVLLMERLEDAVQVVHGGDNENSAIRYGGCA